MIKRVSLCDCRSLAAGCHDIIRETYDSSIRAARSAFEALGHPRDQAERLVEAFENFDRKTMVETAQAFIQSADPHSEKSAHSQMVRENLDVWEQNLKAKMREARDLGSQNAQSRRKALRRRNRRNDTQSHDINDTTQRKRIAAGV